jgi:hypothetical protein
VKVNEASVTYCMFVPFISGEFPQPKHDRKVVWKHINDMTRELTETIDLDSGFLDYLFGKKTLSREHVEELEKTPYNKNDKFLDFLLYRYDGDYSEVLEALSDTGQQHVVNLIISAGGMFLGRYYNYNKTLNKQEATCKLQQATCKKSYYNYHKTCKLQEKRRGYFNAQLSIARRRTAQPELAKNDCLICNYGGC